MNLSNLSLKPNDLCSDTKKLSRKKTQPNTLIFQTILEFTKSCGHSLHRRLIFFTFIGGNKI